MDALGQKESPQETNICRIALSTCVIGPVPVTVCGRESHFWMMTPLSSLISRSLLVRCVTPYLKLSSVRVAMRSIDSHERQSLIDLECNIVLLLREMPNSSI